MSLLTVEEALERLLGDAKPCAAELAPLHEAAGRALATAVTATRTQPPFDASAMDGYAVRAADIADAGARLRVIGESAAGARFHGTLGAGEAVRIFTGAPVPSGADTILLQEDAIVGADGSVEPTEATPAGRHIRRAGLDFEKGDLLLDAGRVLDAAALSLAAAGGHPALNVVARPLVAIMATGDELVDPGTAMGPDQIVASNSYGVAALAREAGARILDLGIVADDEAAIAAAFSKARDAGADAVVTLGGASVGDHDLVRQALSAQGMSLDFWKIAMRPGKPLMFGRHGAIRVLGLPGNPVSSLVCAHLFLVPLVARLCGRQHHPEFRTARIGTEMGANGDRRDYVRAHLVEGPDGPVATPFATQDSSMLRTLAASNCLIVRESGAPASQQGDPCRVLMLR